MSASMPANTRADPRHAAPRQPGPAPRRQHFGAKAVGSFLPALTTKAFQKYGFSTVALITDWPTIVGAELARATAPERLKWRRLPEGGEDEAGDPPATRSGATLILRVDGARALQVQYQARQIIERINAYFGYAAVSDLRLIQAPAAIAAAPTSDPAKAPARPLTHEVAGIAHVGLRDALARLGGEIRAVC
jgi:hypothetical protein